MPFRQRGPSSPTMVPPMTPVEDYRAALDGVPLSTEGLSILVAAGASIEEVAAALEVQVDAELSDHPELDGDWSGYAMTEVPGGVLAIELTGYADPSLSAMRTISGGGRSAATVRGNIQAHDRFGCARDGEVLFDDDEYPYVEDRGRVPEEIRELFDLAWDDLDVEVGSEEDDVESGFVVGLAMAEVITGLRIGADDLKRAMESGFRPAPSLRYVSELDNELG